MANAQRSMTGFGNTSNSTFKGAATGIGGSVGVIRGHLSNLQSAFLGLGAVIAGGAGLFAIAKGAIESGENIYQIAQKLHITGDEAAYMNRLLTEAGVGVDGFNKTLIRLDKIALSGSTEALDNWGVKLTDANGKLLSTPAQLKTLASAYNALTDETDQQAFSAEVLGTRGQELIPLLEDYARWVEAAGDGVGIGIDIEQAHLQFQEMQKLKFELGTLSLTFGKALMPIVEDLMPKLTESLASLAQFVKNHPNLITTFLDVAGVSTAIGAITFAFGPLFKSLTGIYGAYKKIALPAKAATLAIEASGAAAETATGFFATLGGVLGGVVFALAAIAGFEYLLDKAAPYVEGTSAYSDRKIAETGAAWDALDNTPPGEAMAPGGVIEAYKPTTWEKITGRGGGPKLTDEELLQTMGFASGGIVPGPIGAPQFAIVHGGEEVKTIEQQRKAAGVMNVTGTVTHIFKTNDGLTVAKLAEEYSRDSRRLPGRVSLMPF